MQDDWKPNVKALVSLALSCLSLVCCVHWSLSLAMAVAAIVLGILGVRDENPNQEDAAIAGIVVGIVGLLLAVFIALLYIRITNNSSQQNLESVVRAVAEMGQLIS